MMFTVNDPLELFASLLTYLDFAALVYLAYHLPVMPPGVPRRLFRLFLYGLAALSWFGAIGDTTFLHLLPDDLWPEWSYWRRIVTRASRVLLTLWLCCLYWQGRGAQKTGHWRWWRAQKTGHPRHPQATDEPALPHQCT
jgi:hypothetical protein